MARQVVTTTEYTDDLDGSTAAGTVTFAFDGTAYEIDLSKANTRAFEKALKPYRDAARRVRSAKRARPSNKQRDLGAIRAWARDSGYEISDRGRVAQAVIDAYDMAT